jgi:hypothetical protein
MIGGGMWSMGLWSLKHDLTISHVFQFYTSSFVMSSQIPPDNGDNKENSGLGTPVFGSDFCNPSLEAEFWFQPEFHKF